VGGSHDPKKEQTMIAKRFVLATSAMVLIAVSGQALASVTISGERYWPDEINSAGLNAVHRPENDSYSAVTLRGIEASRQSYRGGPKRGGGDGFCGNRFGGDFEGTPGDCYRGYDNRASGLRGGYRGYAGRDVWGHWGTYYGPMI
jgi:hypothetical protein